jgi:hypothetical protein
VKLAPRPDVKILETNPADSCGDIVSKIVLPAFGIPASDEQDYKLVTSDGIWMEPKKRLADYQNKLKRNVSDM